jgi:DNA modification methylase
MLADALKYLATLANQANAPHSLPLDDPRAFHFAHAGAFHFADKPPSPREHELGSLSDLVAFAEKHATGDSRIFFDRGSVVMILDGDGHRIERATVSLQPSGAWIRLKELNGPVSGVWLEHKPFLRMLRRDFGDARRLPLADGSVHCVVTSPPYFGLRDYGTAGQIGLEPTPAAYVAEMVAVFREVRRVLRDDGVCWLNIGDSYATGAGSARNPGGSVFGKQNEAVATGSYPRCQPNRMPLPGLKPKDLIGIPWLVAFALRDDGWYLRQDIIWAKPNPMPESVTDRCTKAHEYVFLLAKRPRYYYDAEAVKEPFQTDPKENYPARAKVCGRGDQSSSCAPIGAPQRDKSGGYPPSPSGMRNLRSVWSIATTPYPGAHFATMPPELARRCIRAGTSERGCCPACGAPWERILERTAAVIHRSGRGEAMGRFSQTAASGTMVSPPASRTIKWVPTCGRRCPDVPPVPCVVFDPFNGAGTTGMVAAQEGRRYVGFDLSDDYIGQARRRIADGLRPVSKFDPSRSIDPLPGQMELFA